MLIENKYKNRQKWIKRQWKNKLLTISCINATKVPKEVQGLSTEPTLSSIKMVFYFKKPIKMGSI